MSAERFQSILVKDPTYTRKIMGGRLLFINGNTTVDGKSVATFADIPPTGYEKLIPSVEGLSIRPADDYNGCALISDRDMDLTISFKVARTTAAAIGSFTFCVDPIIENDLWQDVTPVATLWSAGYAIDDTYAIQSTIVPLPKGFGLYMFNDADSGDFTAGVLVVKPLQPN